MNTLNLTPIYHTVNTSDNNRTKLIVITPVRNEAWVLEAFLAHCSSWADHIIIADQYSTDGSREICAKFPKVTLIDNPTREWVEYKCRARLLEEAQRIPGDKIIFGLDADEFLSEGFEKTEGWRHIVESQPNEIFCFSWLNLFGDYKHGEIDNFKAEWAAHFPEEMDIVNEYLQREKHAVHCQRVPCLENCRYTEIDDIRFVHLGSINRQRVRNKVDFYQVVNIDKNPDKANPISMYRSYTDIVHHQAPLLDKEVRICSTNNDDLRPLLQHSNNGRHFIDEMAAIFQREGVRKFYPLCIWDNKDLRDAGINAKPTLPYRLIHHYLRTTQAYKDKALIRIIDKVLKKVI